MNRQHNTTATLALLALGLACFQGVHAAEQGWFSGISAPTYTPLFESDFMSDQGALWHSSKQAGGLYSPSPVRDFTLAPRSFSLGGSGLLPLNDRFGLIGKLSSTRAETDPTLSSWNEGLSDAFSYNRMGLGLKYDVTRSLRFQGGWDRYQLKYNRINGDAGVDLLSIGLKYGF